MSISRTLELRENVQKSRAVLSRFLGYLYTLAPVHFDGYFVSLFHCFMFRHFVQTVCRRSSVSHSDRTVIVIRACTRGV